MAMSECYPRIAKMALAQDERVFFQKVKDAIIKEVNENWRGKTEIPDVEDLNWFVIGVATRLGWSEEDLTKDLDFWTEFESLVFCTRRGLIKEGLLPPD
jgi:hypothetical protein